MHELRYGDIYPYRTLEYVVSCACQGFGGIMWAMFIGSICAFLANADPGKIRHDQTMVSAAKRVASL